MTTKLVDALKAKYKTGREALRALGLDEGLLDDEGTLLRKNADKIVSRLLKKFGSTEKVLAKLGMDQSMLTEPEHMRSDPRGAGGGGGEIMGGHEAAGVAREMRGEDRFGLRSSRDHIPPKIETNEEDLSKDEDLTEEEERALQEHASDMRRRGEDDRVIDHAMRMARDVLRRQRGHADDRLPRRVSIDDHTDDRMPLRAGRFDRPRFGRDFEAVEPPHGLDSSINSSRREINEIHRLLKRFGPEAGCCPERFRGATDGQPLSEAQTAELYRMFPDLARIGSASEDGVSIRNGTYKSRYEV